jgi:hypothetical protein
MYLFRKYIPTDGEERDLIEKEIEEVLKPMEKKFQRRYTVSIVEERDTDSGVGSIGGPKLSREPRYSIHVIGHRTDALNSRRDSNRFHTLPKRKNYSSFQVNDKEWTQPVHSRMPERLMIAFGAICFATILVAETAFLDYSPTFFRYYSDVKGMSLMIRHSISTLHNFS